MICISDLKMERSEVSSDRRLNLTIKCYPLKREVLPGHRDCQILAAWLLWPDRVTVQTSFRDLTHSYPPSGMKTLRQTVLKFKINFIQYLLIMIQHTPYGTRLFIIPSHQCTGNHLKKWAKMAKVTLYLWIIYHCRSPAFACTSQCLWKYYCYPRCSEAPLNLTCIQLFIVDTSPFPLTATAGFVCSGSMKSYSCYTNEECQAAEQSSLKILQCSCMHWGHIPLFSTQHLDKSRLIPIQ